MRTTAAVRQSTDTENYALLAQSARRMAGRRQRVCCVAENSFRRQSTHTKKKHPHSKLKWELSNKQCRMQLGGLYLWSSGGFGAVHRHFVCELYFTDKMSVNASDQESLVFTHRGRCVAVARLGCCKLPQGDRGTYVA